MEFDTQPPIDLPIGAVEADMNAPSTMDSLKAAAQEMREIQDDIAEREEIVKKLKERFDFLRLRKIPDMMENLGAKTATFEGIGRVQLASDLYCSTIKGRKEEAMQWLRDCGYGDMISESYNATSMKALIRRQIEEGIETPDFLSVTPFMRASIVKSAG